MVKHNLIDSYQRMPLQKKVSMGFALLLATFSLFAVSMFNAIHDAEQADRWVKHTHAVIGEANHLIKLMVDMETGLRGFLIVGRENFLEPYHTSRAIFDHAITELKKRVSDNPQQQKRLDDIGHLSQVWQNRVAIPLINDRRAVQGGGKELSHLQSLLSRETGKSLFDDLRKILDRLHDGIERAGTMSPESRQAALLLTVHLGKDMVDQETGQRGFLITGQESFLEPLNAGRQAFVRHIETLKRLPGLDGALLSLVTEVALSAREWWQRAGEPEIAIRREITRTRTNLESIKKRVESETGKTFMDRIRDEIDAFVLEEKNLMARRTTESHASQAFTENMALGGGLLTLLVGLLILAMVRYTIDPLNRLTRLMAEIAAGDDHTRRVEVGGMVEVVGIAEVFNRMAGNTEDQVWLKTSATHLSQLLQETTDTIQLARKLTATIGERLQCGFAAFYLRNDANGRYELFGSYRFKERNHACTAYAPGEGLVGQCALENRVMILTGIPETYTRIHSGLGEAAPDTVMAIPVTFQEQVLAVLEVATFGRFTPIQQALVEEQVPIIAMGLQSLLRSRRTQELLEETRTQAEELQVREEELKNNNALLERHTRELKENQAELESSNEQMQVQQEELRVANEELEEKTDDLLASRAELEKRNRQLGDIKLELERRAEQLAISSKYKSEFLANMSHELRTPLNSLLILSKLLTDNKDNNLTEKQVAYARTIHDSGGDLLRLINDILDLSKIESGKMALHVEPVQLADFTAGIEKKFTPLAHKKGISFDIEADAAPADWITDGQKLNQIINNFLSNAIKFTSKGGVTLTIAPPAPGTAENLLPGLPESATLVFTVRDTGIGIAKDKQDIIFEAFQQADGTTSRKFGGTGLGLSISRELAKLLGGALFMESEEGEGSAFHLIIPSEPIPPASTAASQRPAPESPPAPPTDPETALPVRSLLEKPVPPMDGSTSEAPDVPDDRLTVKPGDRTLLIIEDDPRFAAIVADVARERGFKVLLAEDGQSGLYLAQCHLPSGIILDIGLPGMNGWQVMEQLKDNPQTRHIPIHFMSASDRSFDAMRSGAVGFLTKPVSMSQMQEAFRRIENISDRPMKRLLLVEDDPVQGETIRELIGNGDVETVVAETGQEAQRYLDEGTFDCIVLDMGLPDMSGLELLEKLRLRERNPQIPVIIHTARELEPRERVALDRHAQSIIIKDVRSPERLLDDTALFLHRVESDLPEEQRRTIRMLHDTEAVFQGRKVLLVDDDMRNIFSLSAILQEKEMEVITATNGREALERLADNADIAIIMIDIMMPEMDGYEAIRKIRQQPRHARLPVIALTAKAMHGDRSHCIEAGASDYLSKPVDTDKLLSMMRVWLYQ